MIYKNITNFLKNRTIELIGLTLISVALLLVISFLSYSPSDPSFIYGTENVPINNLLGIYGGLVVDFLLLGWIGQNVVEFPFIEIGQVLTLFYFLYFLLILPFLSYLEYQFCVEGIKE